MPSSTHSFQMEKKSWEVCTCQVRKLRNGPFIYYLLCATMRQTQAYPRVRVGCQTAVTIYYIKRELLPQPPTEYSTLHNMKEICSC